MIQPTLRVPFTIDDLYAGFAKASGLLRIEQDDLLMEFQVQDNLLGGIVKGRPQGFRIPIEALDSAEYKKNWLGSRVIIRVQRLSDLEGVPGAERGEVKLKIRKEDRTRAQDLIGQLNIRLSEFRLADMDTFD